MGMRSLEVRVSVYVRTNDMDARFVVACLPDEVRQTELVAGGVAHVFLPPGLHQMADTLITVAPDEYAVLIQTIVTGEACLPIGGSLLVDSLLVGLPEIVDAYLLNIDAVSRAVIMCTERAVSHFCNDGGDGSLYLNVAIDIYGIVVVGKVDERQHLDSPVQLGRREFVVLVELGDVNFLPYRACGDVDVGKHVIVNPGFCDPRFDQPVIMTDNTGIYRHPQVGGV